MKKTNTKIIFLLIIFIFLIFLKPNYSLALDGTEFGGKLLAPIMDLFASLCDGIITIVQQTVIGSDGDVIVNIDRAVSIWSIIATIAVGLIIVAAAFFAGPAGGIVATIAFIGKTVVITAKAVVITYFVVKTATSTMLPTSFNLPFIELSPDNIFKNKIEMFDVNFFSPETPEKKTAFGQTIDYNEENHIAYKMQSIISKWYYSLRNMAIVCFMVTLVYIGIRMILTSIASEKAKYKNMFIDWLVAFCLLFVIHYIMIFSMQIVNSITDFICVYTRNGVEYIDITDDKVYDYVEKMQKELGNSDDNTGADDGTYSTLYKNSNGDKTVRFPIDNFLSQARIEMQLAKKDGNDNYARIGWGIVYVMLTLYTVVFVFIYLKRVVYIAFLILVSPFVVLTYPLDRLRDGQAQGFNTWLKEYIFNLAIQPFHLILYTIFVDMAMELASTNPVYVLVILGFMFQAEKILREMFGFNRAKTPGALSGAIGTGLAMTGLQKVLGRSPHHVKEKKMLDNKYEESGSESSRIRKQDIDNMIPGEESSETKSANSSYYLDNDSGYKEDEEMVGFGARNIFGKENSEETQEKGDDPSEENTNIDTKMKKTVTLSDDSNDKLINKPRINTKVKRKAKFKLKRAIKGTARHYAKKTSDRIKDSHPIRGLVSGVSAITAGTAGVLLGAMEGPDKALRNAGVLGAVAYKGTSNRLSIGNDIKNDIQDNFIKAGYGSDYKLYKQNKEFKEIKNDIENRTILEDELGWNSKEINEFFKKTMDEYIESGIKQLNDMVIGEKLKKNKVAKDTKEALTIMYMGQKVGKDTTKLTKKQKQEWSETLMERSSTMSKIQEQIKKKQKEYNQQIKEVLEKKLDKAEEDRQIEKIKIQRETDKELNGLKKSVENFQDKTFEKLDKYSEYKYKE